MRACLRYFHILTLMTTCSGIGLAYALVFLDTPMSVAVMLLSGTKADVNFRNVNFTHPLSTNTDVHFTHNTLSY